MKTYYQLSDSQFSVNGVLAISMSDEHYDILKGKVEFLDENSKEVLEHKELKAAEALEQDKANAAKQAERDEDDILKELLKEQFADKIKERLLAKQAARIATTKLTKKA